MLVLTILLLMLVVMLVLVAVLLVATGQSGLLTLVVPMAPMMVMIGSGVLGLIELLLLFGGRENRRLAKKELKYLGAAFVISGALSWVSTYFLWRL